MPQILRSRNVMQNVKTKGKSNEGSFETVKYIRDVEASSETKIYCTYILLYRRLTLVTVW